MKRRFSAAALAVAGVAALAAGPAHAAGPPASAFVPDGYRVEQRVTGQIGGDATPDVVLVVRQNGRVGGADAPQLNRRLLILKARSDGGYVLIGDGRRILVCTRCGGAFFGVLKTPVHVSIQKGVVIVEQEFGAREMTFQRFRLRPEGALKTRLIGTDITNTDRATAVVVETSTNLLTGDRIVTRSAPGRDDTRRASKVPVKVVYLEGVRLEDY